MPALYLAILFLLISIVLFIISARRRHLSGMPVGRVIYTDTTRWAKVEKPLYDDDIRLAGKPDYLVEYGNQIIPVELKSGKTPGSPYEAHIFQLAAYCLLVQHVYGKRPTHGIIHYPKRTFAVDFTENLEDSVKMLIQEMQQRTSHLQTDRSHNEPERCVHCGYRLSCDHVLRI